MTDKEIDIQTALGTIQVDKLTSREFTYWMKGWQRRLARYVQEFKMGPKTLQHIVASKHSLGARKTRNNTP
ncbi:hypothetical protein LCGC14_1461490, partial [marine sediment metagenome]